MFRIATFILILCSIPFLSLAETVYVSDSLRVGVRSEPNNTVPPHGVVVTGMQLEVLERAHGYIKIRNGKGVEGWIKDVYVTTDKPAKLELSDMQKEQATLQSKLAEQEKRIKDNNARTGALSAELDKLKSENRRLQTQVKVTVSDTKDNQTVGYLLYAAWLVMVAVAGFVAGAVWHRRQAMKRLGGLRV